MEVKTDLEIEPMQLNVHMDAINRIDRKIIERTRDGFVYKRNKEIVGYGYVGSSSGPFAVLDDNDFPAVLSHAEAYWRKKGVSLEHRCR